MSGHSHWSTIKRKKASEDQKKGKVFSKLSRVISLAARKGTDPDFNFQLRKALDEAKKYNMPRENVKRALEKGDKAEEGFEEIRLEGYGPAGIAILIDVLTDNKNRTVSEIRSIMQRHGGSLGEQGSAAYIFAKNPENPLFLVSIKEEKTVRQVLNLMNSLDEHDDVQELYANFDIPEEFISR